MSLIATSPAALQESDRHVQIRPSAAGQLPPNTVERALEREIRRPVLASLALVVLTAATTVGLGIGAWRSTRVTSVTAANVLADPVRYRDRALNVWAVQAFASEVRTQVANGAATPLVTREYRVFHTGGTPLYVGAKPGTTGTAVVGRLVRTPEWIARMYPQVGEWVVEEQSVSRVGFLWSGLAMLLFAAALAAAGRSVRRWRNPAQHPGVVALAEFGRADVMIDSVQQDLLRPHPSHGPVHVTDDWLVSLERRRLRVLLRADVAMVHIARQHGVEDRSGKGGGCVVVKAKSGKHLELTLRSADAAASTEHFLTAQLGLSQRL
jgi:hypothetical protein